MRRAFYLTVAIIASVAVACASDSATPFAPAPAAAPAAKVARINLSVSDTVLATGQTTSIIAQFVDLSGNPVTDLASAALWTTSNPSVAAVSVTGVVTAVAPGSSIITVSAAGKTASTDISVIVPPQPSISSINIAFDSAAVHVGHTGHAVATLKDSLGNVLTDRPVVWDSDNRTVAAVSSTGDVSALAPGTTNVSVWSEGKTTSATFTVSADPPPVHSNGSVSAVGVVVATSGSVTVGGASQATVTLIDSVGNLLNGRVVTWSSGNPAVASVSATGLVTGVRSGVAVISATSEGKTGAASIDVLPGVLASIATIDVFVAPTIAVGGQVTAVAVVKDSAGNVLSGRAIVWTSSNPTFARVSASGVVSGIAPGAAAISASSGGKTGTAPVAIGTPSAVTSVAVTVDSNAISVGSVGHATATPRDAAGIPVPGQTIVWTSANTRVATVSASGTFTGVTAGTSAITASTAGISGSSTVVVAASVGPVSSVSVSFVESPALTIAAQAHAVAVLRASDGTVVSAPVAWTTSDPTIAGVTSAGVVTGTGVGSAIITATSGGKSGGAPVTVGASVGNEPSGMTVITERSFNCSQDSCEDGWVARNPNNLFTIVTDPTAPQSAPNVGQMAYPAGYVGGGEPANAEKDFGRTPVGTLYISFWIKFSSNWVGHPTSVNKTMNMWVGDSPTDVLQNRIVAEAKGTGNAPLIPVLALQGLAAPYDNGLDLPSTGLFLRPNLVPNAVLTRGQWAKWEILLTANSAGTADATAQWWVDGVRVGSYGGIKLTNGPGKWQAIQWAPVWGGLGGLVTANQFMWVDHIYVSGK